MHVSRLYCLLTYCIILLIFDYVRRVLNWGAGVLSGLLAHRMLGAVLGSGDLLIAVKWSMLKILD